MKATRLSLAAAIAMLGAGAMSPLPEAHKGLGYRTIHRRVDGSIKSDTLDLNLVPIQGFNHMLGVVLKGVVPITNWYVMIWEGNYDPDEEVTAATLPGLANECVAYTPGARPLFVAGVVAGGSCDNTANPAVYTFTADKTIYGAALVGAAAKGATSSVVLSAVRFAVPKVVTTGESISVYAGPTALPFNA